MHSVAWRPRAAEPLGGAGELAAARRLIERVIQEVPADLVQASLFGSHARGEARHDSDIDILLVFRRLPPDREPHATHAEEIADEVAERTAVPVTVWSVSLPDLEPGARTPMLVDALEDSIPLWCSGRPLPAVPFTPVDAVRCIGALLDRVAEGEVELVRHLDTGAIDEAAMRLRDDLVRMCTALELLRGNTRPRRGELPRRVLRSEDGTLTPGTRRALAWAAASYGEDGRDSESPVPQPRDPLTAMRAVGTLRRLVDRRRAELARSLHAGDRPDAAPPPAPPGRGTRIAPQRRI